MVAEHSVGMNVVEDPSWYLLNIWYFEVYYVYKPNFVVSLLDVSEPPTRIIIISDLSSCVRLPLRLDNRDKGKTVQIR
jgi:hypothetical protein